MLAPSSPPKSQERVLPIEKEVGAAFLRDVLRQKDLAFVIGFDVNVSRVEELTVRKELIN